jgi:hypothetical protein
VLQALEENNCQFRIVYPAKQSSIIEGEIKTFHDEQKQKEFMKSKPVLQRYLYVSYTEKRKVNITMRIQERINLAK